MIKKGLRIIRDWNPTATPKFGMADLDEKEINALKVLFPDIEVFIDSFHREQAWTRWTNKSKQGVHHIADDFRYHLCRTAHGSSREELDKLIEDFL